MIQAFFETHHWSIVACYLLVLSLIEFESLKKFRYTFSLLPWFLMNEIVINGRIMGFVDYYFNNKFHSFIFYKIPIPNQYLVNFTFIFFVFEFMNYFLHRLFHRNKYLWNIHKIHHNTSQMTWSLSFKYHFLEPIIFFFPRFIILFIFNINVAALWTYQTIEYFWNLYVHSGKEYKFSPIIENFLNTVKAHHWHHHRSTFHKGGQNFGDITLIYDNLFKTKHNPEEFPTEVGMSVSETLVPSIKSELINPLTSNYKLLTK
jgi:sterol desaturase/sphingolipid hydroxylase (fatty acid hydroxylase superfamily)